MPILSREQILNRKRELPRETVHVKEWGGEVIVRALSSKERDAWEASILARKFDGKGKVSVKENMANMRARLCAMTIVDEKGDRIYADTDADDLGNDSAAALDTIYAVATRLSGISKEDEEELAGKNSETSPAGSSPSA